MLRLAGWWWIAVSLIHALVCVIQYSDQWSAIAFDGWFNVIAPNPTAPIYDREDALEVYFSYTLIFLIGELCLWVDRRQIVFPISVGIILTGTMIIGVFLIPVSGLWLALPPSIMMLSTSKSGRASNNS